MRVTGQVWAGVGRSSRQSVMKYSQGEGRALSRVTSKSEPDGATVPPKHGAFLPLTSVHGQPGRTCSLPPGRDPWVLEQPTHPPLTGATPWPTKGGVPRAQESPPPTAALAAVEAGTPPGGRKEHKARTQLGRRRESLQGKAEGTVPGWTGTRDGGRDGTCLVDLPPATPLPARAGPCA